MSRREGRESDSKRLNSRNEREISPKRSRRDGKPATERTSSSRNLEVVDHTDRDRKQHRRLHDALPLEAPLAPESKAEPNVANRESNKNNGMRDGTKRSSNPTDVPRPQSYFQHEERGSAGEGGRSLARRTTTERGSNNPKDQSSDVPADKTAPHETQKRSERSQVRSDDNNVWRHDGFFELEKDAPPPARKRPAFREKKILPDSENAGMPETEPVRAKHTDRPISRSERREERGSRYPRDLYREEKPLTGDKLPLPPPPPPPPPHRGDTQRASFQSRERFGGGNNSFKGRERFTGRHGEGNQNRRTGYHMEKWKHDLFDEANRSPPPKNEEDQIAKVEALLAL